MASIARSIRQSDEFRKVLAKLRELVTEAGARGYADGTIWMALLASEARLILQALAELVGADERAELKNGGGGEGGGE